LVPTDNFRAPARVQYGDAEGFMYRFVTSIAAAVLLSCTAPLFAQSQTATLKLTVVDPTGAVLPGDRR
jgi:hypothetical protein